MQIYYNYLKTFTSARVNRGPEPFHSGKRVLFTIHFTFSFSIMTTQKDVEQSGLKPNRDGTSSYPNSDKKYLVTEGNTKQVYVKEVGRAYDGIEPFDPKKHTA